MRLTKQRLKEIIKKELSEAITAGPEGRQLEQDDAFTSVKDKLEELLLAKLAEDTSTHGSEADWYSVIEDRLGDLQELWNWLDGAPIREGTNNES